MLGVIASICLRLTTLGSINDDQAAASAFVYSNSLGVRVEVAGICSIDENSVVAWNPLGQLDEKLRKEVLADAGEEKGRYYNFRYGYKSRQIIFRISGPTGVACNIMGDDGTSSSSIRGVELRPKSVLVTVPISVDRSLDKISMRVQVPTKKTLLASFEPKSNQQRGSGEDSVSLTRVARFTEGSVSPRAHDTMNAEIQLLAFNDKAWAFFFDIPLLQTNEGTSIQLIGKNIESPEYVDIDGKPIHSNPPNWEKLMEIYSKNLEPDPRLFVNYAQSYTLNVEGGNRILATNINPKYIQKIDVFRTAHIYTTFRNIPLDPSRN